MKNSIYFMAVAAVLAGIAVWFLKSRGGHLPPSLPPPVSAVENPADLRVLSNERDIPVESEGNPTGPEAEDEQLPEDMAETNIPADFPLSPEGIDVMPTLSLPSQFSRRVEQLQNETTIPLDEYGRPMLSSTNPRVRALGGILLSKAEALDEAARQQIMSDEDLSVPFLVLEWVRDFGPADLAAALSDALALREMTTDELADAILAGHFAAGGGRVAVDQLVARLPPEERTEALLEIADHSELAYDVRMRSVLLLGSVPEADPYREALTELKASATSELDDWAQSLTRLQERIYDDEGQTVLPRNQITTRDLYLILGNDYPTVVRDAALFLEDRLLIPGVAVEPGSADIVAEFIKEFPDREREWNVEDEESLQRLMALHLRLAILEPPPAAPSSEVPPWPPTDEESIP